MSKLLIFLSNCTRGDIDLVVNVLLVVISVVLLVLMVLVLLVLVVLLAQVLVDHSLSWFS